MGVSIRRQVLPVRWVLILATAYLVLFTKLEPNAWNDLLIVAYIISNLGLAMVPHHWFERSEFYYVLVPADTAIVCFALYVSGTATTDFYLIFFLVIVIAAIGRNLHYVLTGAAAISVFYGWMVFSSGEGAPLLRIVFLLVVAFFIGHLVQQASREKGKTHQLLADKRRLEEVETELRASEAKFRLLAESTSSAIFIWQDNRLQYVNSAAEAMTGYTREELLSLNSWELFSSDFRELARELSLVLQLENELATRREIMVTTKEREERWLDLTAGKIEYEGQPAGMGTAYDLTGRKELEADLLREAYHDSLTGLPNRAFLQDVVGRMAVRARKSSKFGFALVYMDLDDFKEVNDTLGHEAGDRLLVAFGSFLRKVLRPADLITRLGGDEFAIVLRGVQKFEEASMIVSRIEGGLREPIRIGEISVWVKVSTGIAVSGSEYPDLDSLIRVADQAMYETKSLRKKKLKPV